MKSLPTETESFQPLHDMLTGRIHARLLESGLALGVFDALAEFRTPDEAAAALGTHGENTRHFLDALATIGLVEKESGRYRNTSLSRQYLVSGSELFLGPLFRIIRASSIDPIEKMEELVRNGPRSGEIGDDAGLGSLCIEAARASAPWALGEMGNRMARMVSQLPGFADFEKMLDLGGGHGIFAFYMVRESRGMNAVVFDLPAVEKTAAEFIDAYGMGDRVRTMAGDYLKDPIGEGYDLVWASAALTFAKGDLTNLIAKIYTAVKPGGYFIALQDGMTHEGTRPETILGWLAGLLTTGQDQRLAQGELADIMLAQEFRQVRSRTIDTPMGLLDLDIARK